MTFEHHGFPALRARSTRRDLFRGAALGLGAPALATLAGSGLSRPAAAQDTVTVNFHHSIPPETEQVWAETLLPGFYELHPGCTIEAQNYGRENATTIRTQVQAGGEDAPHMVWLASTEQGIFSEAGVLADVQAWLDEHAAIRDNIDPSLFELSSYDGAVRTLP